MKKFIAIVLCLVLSASLLLCGCDTKTADKDKGNSSFGTTLVTDDTQPDPDPVPTPVNEFTNNNNFFYDMDSVSIRPKHLYWDGDMLVAECFVTNGKNTTVSNIQVERLAFGNEAVGTFVDGAFGHIDGLSVPAYGYAVWTFTFSDGAVAHAGADLSSLTYESNVSFSH